MTPEERLRELYAADPLDQRAVALTEREVWGARETKGERIQDFFCREYGLKKRSCPMYRQFLLGHDAWAEPLWSLIGTVSLRKVYGICNEIRSDLSERAARAQRLAENPDEARRFKCSDGKRAESRKTVDTSPAEARELRQRIREIVEPFAHARLAELEGSAVAADIVAVFDREVDAAVTDLLRRVGKARGTNGARGIIGVRRSELRHAYELLGLTLPPKGGTVDIEAARRAHRKLSAQFHPDRTNNNEQLTAQYLQVQQAWEVISEYRA